MTKRMRALSNGVAAMVALSLMVVVAPSAGAAAAPGMTSGEVPVATTVVDDATYAQIRAAAPDLPGESDQSLPGASSNSVRIAAGSPPNTSLPYDSTYSVLYSLHSSRRWMTPTTGKACVYIRSSRPGVYITVSIDIDGGTSAGTASFPQDGVTRQYCFLNLRKDYVYHLYIVKPQRQDYPAEGNVTVTA